jgi:hypothetical protein
VALPALGNTGMCVSEGVVASARAAKVRTGLGLTGRQVEGGAEGYARSPKSQVFRQRASRRPVGGPQRLRTALLIGNCTAGGAPEGLCSARASGARDRGWWCGWGEGKTAVAGRDRAACTLGYVRPCATYPFRMLAPSGGAQGRAAPPSSVTSPVSAGTQPRLSGDVCLQLVEPAHCLEVCDRFVAFGGGQMRSTL